jgi:hypothetical protein
MQNHDQGGILPKEVRSIGQHAQTARVRPKAEHFLQPTVERSFAGTGADPTSARRAKQFQKSRSAAVETVWRLKLYHVRPFASVPGLGCCTAQFKYTRQK